MNSISLVALSVAVSLVIALPLGILSAVRRNRPRITWCGCSHSFAFAMPAFWTSLLLVLYSAFDCRMFPTSGLGQSGVDICRQPYLAGVSIGLYLAPSFCGACAPVSSTPLPADFVEAARARGSAKTGFYSSMFCAIRLSR